MSEQHTEQCIREIAAAGASKGGVCFAAHAVHVFDEKDAEIDALRKFKEYVHKRLDEAGVPHEVPESEHTKAGCRIGGRLDWLMECLFIKPVA